MKIIAVLKKACLTSPAAMKFFSMLYTVVGGNTFKIGRRNKFVHDKAFFRRCKIRIHGSNNHIFIEEGANLHNCIIAIHGSNNEIHLQKRCKLINSELYIEDDENRILIGEHTSLCGETHIACTEGTEVIIGKECLFSSQIYIRTGDSHSILDENDNRINPAESVVISDRVWICNDAKILKGVKIPEKSIVATGAVVTKKFEENNVILAGIPATIVKRNISWKHEKI